MFFTLVSISKGINTLYDSIKAQKYTKKLNSELVWDLNLLALKDEVIKGIETKMSNKSAASEPK